MRTPRATAWSSVAAFAVCLAVSASAAQASEVRECSRSEEIVFAYRGNKTRSDDEDALCERRGGTVREIVTLRVCIAERKNSLCRKLYGGDFIFFYEKDCCAYDPPSEFGW